jgi:hypothetical protein
MIILHNFHHVWISVTRYVYPILYIYHIYVELCILYFYYTSYHYILYIYILALWPIYISKPSKLYMYLFVTICRYPLLYIYIYITLYAGLVLWYTTSPVIFFLIFCLLCISSIIIYIDGRYFDTTILHCPYIYTYIHYYIHIIVPLLHYVSIYTSCIFYSNDYTLK